jgi:hypothetical protein
VAAPGLFDIAVLLLLAQCCAAVHSYAYIGADIRILRCLLSLVHIMSRAMEFHVRGTIIGGPRRFNPVAGPAYSRSVTSISSDRLRGVKFHCGET